MISKVDVVVLAGGGALKADPAGSRKKGGHPPGRARDAGEQGPADYRGRPMVDYVVAALSSCPDVGRIVLVGDASLRKAYCPPPGLLFALPGDSPLGSLASGAAVLESRPRMLRTGLWPVPGIFPS